MYNLQFAHHTPFQTHLQLSSTKDANDHEQAKASQFKAINISLRQLL